MYVFKKMLYWKLNTPNSDTLKLYIHIITFNKHLFTVYTHNYLHTFEMADLLWNVPNPPLDGWYIIVQ